MFTAWSDTLKKELQKYPHLKLTSPSIQGGEEYQSVAQRIIIKYYKDNNMPIYMNNNSNNNSNNNNNNKYVGSGLSPSPLPVPYSLPATATPASVQRQQLITSTVAATATAHNNLNNQNNNMTTKAMYDAAKASIAKSNNNNNNSHIKANNNKTSYNSNDVSFAQTMANMLMVGATAPQMNTTNNSNKLQSFGGIGPKSNNNSSNVDKISSTPPVTATNYTAPFASVANAKSTVGPEINNNMNTTNTNNNNVVGSPDSLEEKGNNATWSVSHNLLKLPWSDAESTALVEASMKHGQLQRDMKNVSTGKKVIERRRSLERCNHYQYHC